MVPLGSSGAVRRGRRSRGRTRGSRRRRAARGAHGDQRTRGCPGLGGALREELGRRRDDAPAGRGERVARSERGAVDVEPRAVDRAERAVEPELGAAVLVVLPGLEGREHGGRERLVDLVEVEVAEREPVAREQARDGVRGGHEQALVAVHEVDGRGLRVHDACEQRQVALARPLGRGEEDGRRAVGERGRVARRHGRRDALEALAVHGLERGELLERRVGAQVVVAHETAERGDEVVEEPGVPRGREVLVARERELVLRLARDAPAGRRDGLVLAHRQAGARLVGRGREGREVGGADLRERLDALAEGLGVARLEQGPAQTLAHGDRGVGHGVGAARDARLDLAETDLVRDGDGRLEPGRARLLEVVGGGLRGERRPEHGLAHEVEVTGVLEHGAADDLPSRSPWRPKRATSPSSAAVNISWLLADAYLLPARANGMRFPPTTHASRGVPAGALSRGTARGSGGGWCWWPLCLTSCPCSLRCVRSRPGRASRHGVRETGERAGWCPIPRVPDTLSFVSRVTGPCPAPARHP